MPNQTEPTIGAASCVQYFPVANGFVAIHDDGRETRYTPEQWAQKALHDRLNQIEAKLDRLLEALHA